MTKRTYHYITPRLPGPDKPASSFWSQKRPRMVPTSVKSTQVDMAKVIAAVQKFSLHS